MGSDEGHTVGLDPDWPTDCGRCAGLCCIATAHRGGAAFPADKPADTPCRHLTDGFRCGVFPALERHGYSVCRPYDCHGAGPVVTARMRAERDTATPGAVASARSHLQGFRELSRLRMLITALRRHGGGDAKAVAARLTPIAESFRETGRVEVDAETSRLMRWHEGLISAILAPLIEQAPPKRECRPERERREES